VSGLPLDKAWNKAIVEFDNREWDYDEDGYD